MCSLNDPRKVWDLLNLPDVLKLEFQHDQEMRSALSISPDQMKGPSLDNSVPRVHAGLFPLPPYRDCSSDLDRWLLLFIGSCSIPPPAACVAGHG